MFWNVHLLVRVLLVHMIDGTVHATGAKTMIFHGYTIY